MANKAGAAKTVKRRYFGKEVDVPVPPVVPEGQEFLALLRQLEDRCEAHTLKALFGAGREANQLYTLFGTLLSLVDRLAGCWWGCDPNMHYVTYVLGRQVGESRAALRLLQFGQYDQAITHARAVGEAANLLILVAHDAGSNEEWASRAKLGKTSKLRPVVVRQRLVKLRVETPIHDRRYGRLSEPIHAAAAVIPQHYGKDTQPRVGGMFQDAGAILVFYELSFALSLLAATATNMLMAPGSVRRHLRRVIVAISNPTFPDDWSTALALAKKAAGRK